MLLAADKIAVVTLMLTVRDLCVCVCVCVRVRVRVRVRVLFMQKYAKSLMGRDDNSKYIGES